eukprot:CAMPEP_0198143276 /NCGR_PEP_ID=MMETSP1443-20131203/6262_1 /TAXON_ID=186043 /ORGANISM="Entomoneis sp., Strain CCMP2396" /LENGTH=274 /DNA_ID=CAMNT_0043806493 /DNA_START=76 /DNA_END=901 /DNA_ORIENTATION=+
MSLTPKHRSSEATSEAVQEGFVAGGMVLLPTLGGLFVALKQSPTFAARTNWQSRTAMAIMPALFSFAWASERHLEYKMHEIAQESQHSRETVKWAEEHHMALSKQKEKFQELDKEVHLIDLYRRSVEESGVCIVPGNFLGIHHRAANYVYTNPFKVLVGLAVPSVALIFYGKSGKEHLQFSMKVLHTRVFGQFTTLALLLSIMGFKDYMDQNGKFITEVDADQRVEEMTKIRKALTDRLDFEEEQRELQEFEIAQAHQAVMKEEAKKGRKGPPE